MATDNFKKHSSKNPLQKFLIGKFLDILIAETEALRPEKILDAGCGEGFILERLRARSVGQVLRGVDIQQQAIDLGRQVHPHLTMQQGSVFELPFEDNAFDVVICSEVLEHLEHPEKALKELARVTRKYTIITVPNEPFFRLANFLRGKNVSRWGNDIEHIQHWSSQGIAEFVNREFEVKKIRTPFPWTIIVGEKRI